MPKRFCAGDHTLKVNVLTPATISTPPAAPVGPSRDADIRTASMGRNRMGAPDREKTSHDIIATRANITIASNTAGARPIAAPVRTALAPIMARGVTISMPRRSVENQESQKSIDETGATTSAIVALNAAPIAAAEQNQTKSLGSEKDKRRVNCRLRNHAAATDSDIFAMVNPNEIPSEFPASRFAKRLVAAAAITCRYARPQPLDSSIASRMPLAGQRIATPSLPPTSPKVIAAARK